MKKNDKITESKEFKDCMKSAERLAIIEFKQALIGRAFDMIGMHATRYVPAVKVSDIEKIAEEMAREGR